MNVLMIAPTPFFAHRGSHIRIFEEARALEKRGHHITIVTYHNGDDIHKYVDTAIDVRRIRRWLFWYKKTEAGADWQKLILNLFLIRKTLHMVAVKKPDVLHGHLHEGVLIGRFVQLCFFWRRLPLIADFHGTLVGEMRSHGYLGTPPLGTIFRFLERWINSLGSAAIVSSAENLKTIKSARKDFRAYHVYDGVDVSTYSMLTKKKSALRMKYQIPQDKTVVVYTGALIKNKGIDTFLDAIVTLSKNPQLHFVIGGFPDAWVRAFITRHHLEDVVTLISPLNYFILPEVNALADIAIDPKVDDSKTKQASGKILQYMAAGLPIICAERMTNRRYLDDAGVYVEQMDAHGIIETIQDLAQKPQQQLEKGHHAKKRAHVFQWEKVGEKIEGVYQSVMRGKIVS